ncbi:MAG: hypothetical protein ACOCUS_05560 [Polyangiales bacterium]
MGRDATTGVLLALVLCLGASSARAEEDEDEDEDRWTGVVAGGGELWTGPETFGHGFALFDVTGHDIAGGRLHMFYNTDTAQVGLEGVQLADGKLELAAALRGQVAFAGLLMDYYQRGLLVDERGFFASYGQLWARAKWHFAPYNTLELLVSGRRWFFRRRGDTDEMLVLPPEAWVFEPRLGYTYWRIDAPDREWEAHRLFPRVTGIGFGLWGELHLRSSTRAWGAPVGGGLDPRNDPDEVILMARQWLRAGLSLGTRVRLQLEQHAGWGEGEDDLTRSRAGGMNPYVVPIPGLPWAALLSERFVAASGGIHVALDDEGRHEIGGLLAGGAFNDVRRTGALDDYGGAGGVALTADPGFGAWQLYARIGYALPAAWQADPPHFAGFATVGVPVF